MLFYFNLWKSLCAAFTSFYFDLIHFISLVCFYIFLFCHWMITDLILLLLTHSHSFYKDLIYIFLLYYSIASMSFQRFCLWFGLIIFIWSHSANFVSFYLLLKFLFTNLVSYHCFGLNLLLESHSTALISFWSFFVSLQSSHCTDLSHSIDRFYFKSFVSFYWLFQCSNFLIPLIWSHSFVKYLLNVVIEIKQSFVCG